MWPHRQQPTRLPCPWDSLGKKTGVGCHFLLQCMKVKSESEVAQSCPTLCNPIDSSPPGFPVPGTFQARVLDWGATAFSIQYAMWEKYTHNTTQSLYVLRCPVTYDSSQPQGLQPARLLGPWDFPGKNTGMGWHFLLQGIFPTQGSNPQFLCLLYWQVDSLPMCHPWHMISYIKNRRVKNMH